MPLTPGITLTATLQDFTGSDVGSAGNPAKLRIALCGYGPSLPGIAGTSNIAKPGPYDILSASGVFSTPLWGNDVITPAGTYYSITILDGDDNVVQCGAYIFTGTQTIDLSNATQISPPSPPLPGGLVCLKMNGTTPGYVFTTPTNAFGGVFAVFYRGVQQRLGLDYTTSGNTVTMLYEVTADPYALYQQIIAAAPNSNPLVCLPLNGTTPGTIFATPTSVLGSVAVVFYRGVQQRLGLDYTTSGNTVTMLYSVNEVPYALYQQVL
jgi:hypothetical protein